MIERGDVVQMPDEKLVTGSVRAVSRALTILNSFVATPGPVSLSALARATKLDKGTARRLLLTLMQDDFVALDPVTQGYVLGPRILLLAGTMNRYRDLSDAMRPILVRLGDSTRATIHLSEEREYEAVCIERYQPEKATVVFPHWNVGGRTMLNSGAAPWLLMAGMSEERVEKMLSDASLRNLLSKPVDFKRIRERLAQFRNDEWALSVDEVADGLTALAVPIRNLSGRTVAAISLVGLTPEMLVDGKPRYLSQALEAAREANRLVASIAPAEFSRGK